MSENIEQATLVTDLGEREKEWVVDAARRQTLSNGISIWRQGDVPEAIALVTEGQLRETMVDAQGVQRTLRLIRAGELVGGASVCSGTPHATSVAATDSTEILWWSIETFARLMLRVPQLAINTLAIVSGEANSLMHRLRAATSESADRRVARVVLRLAGELRPPSGQAQLTISRQELAELCDTTLFTVSRAISAWHRLNIVKAGRGRLTVLDFNRLATLAGERVASV